jgi:hypothetical protein
LVQNSLAPLLPAHRLVLSTALLQHALVGF